MARPRGVAAREMFDRIDQAIEPFDVAGIVDRSRRDWYPALAEDLIANAPKLHATPDEVDALLERCGFR
jgi:FADH2 O2-dependent halogenase